MASPFDQFILKPLLEISLFGYDISITNASASVLIVAVFLSLFCIILSYCINVYPSAMQVAVERVYLLVKNMVDGMIGEKGRGLLPLLFSIFIMIMFMNLFGIIPYNFTPTSHLVFNLI
ncbi:MAG: F0F1 ATP synthase subunit A, partial [Pseudomonadota bacterium]